MLTDMSIDLEKGYRSLKQLGAIVCFQNKKVAQFLCVPAAITATIGLWIQSLPDFDRWLVEIK